MALYDVESAPRGKGWRQWLADRPQMPYLLPLLAFLAVMAPGGMFGHWLDIDWEILWFKWLPYLYTLKTVLAAVLLWVFWRYYTPIKWTHLGLGVVVGLIGVVQWVGTEYAVQALWHAMTGQSGAHYPRLFGSDAKIYDPVKMIPIDHWRYLFYVVRVGGPTLVVPLMEELFFRDFLMRALIRGARFEEVEVGTFTWISLIGMSLLFAVNHYQWPSGFGYGLMMGILLIRTRSLGACIVAHGTTNLVLYAAYCIPRGDWQFM